MGGINSYGQHGKMIHFAYPAARGNSFLGCGRFRVSDEQLAGYEVAEPNTANQSEINVAVTCLVPEFSENGNIVYETKDESTQKFIGYSMDLAYLLALISRSRKLKIPLENDIWCTGIIEIKENRHPFLKWVDAMEFDGKLNGFMSERNQDTLFIVPAANIKNHHLILFQEKNIRLLSLSRSQKTDIKKLFSQKTVLKVTENDLKVLVDTLFQKPFPIRQFFKLSCTLLTIVLLITGIWYYYQSSSPKTVTLTLAETITDYLENGEFARAISLVEKAPRDDVEVMKLKEIMNEPIGIEPKFQYHIVGHKKSEHLPINSQVLKQIVLSHRVIAE